MKKSLFGKYFSNTNNYIPLTEEKIAVINVFKLSSSVSKIRKETFHVAVNA